MRLYTCRGVGTRIIVPEPFPVLTDWSFVALDPAVKKVKKGPKGFNFRVHGLLRYHPSQEVKDSGQDWFTTEVTGIDSEGVITTHHTPYRLAGNSAADKYAQAPASIQEIMATFPGEGCWFAKGRTLSIHDTMRLLSENF
jgi:hypothetical protein